jgi:hypothetical protein
MTMKEKMKDWYDEIFSVICLHFQALDYIKIDINRVNVFVETHIVRTYDIGRALFCFSTDLPKFGTSFAPVPRTPSSCLYFPFLSFFVGPVVNLSSHGPGSCPCLPTRQLRAPALASCPPLSLSTLEAECKSKSDSNHLGDSDPDSDMANPGPQVVVVVRKGNSN